MYVSTPSDDQPNPPTPAADPAPRPSRRVFSPEYKRAIVTEYENAPNGEKGAILRREGLYSSHVIEWARARDAGTLTTSRPTQTQPHPPTRGPRLQGHPRTRRLTLPDPGYTPRRVLSRATRVPFSD